MRWSSDTHDAFHDSVLTSVKELFEDSEAELLPIQKQLKRYKRRNLQASHTNRISQKVFGSQQTLFRHHHIENHPFDCIDLKTSSVNDLKKEDLSIPPFDNTAAVFGPNLSPCDVTVEASDDQNITDWVDQRKKLRNGLSSMGLDISWLKRKADKTCLEESVLVQLKKDNDLKQAMLLEGEKPTTTPKSVSLTLKKVANFLMKDQHWMKLFLGNSDILLRQQCVEILQQVKEYAEIDEKEIIDVLNFYFGEKSSSDQFQKALVIVLKQNKSFAAMSSIPRFHDLNKDDQLDVLSLKKSDRKSVFNAMKEQKEFRLRSLDEISKRFKAEDIPINESSLHKVLLHPDDTERDDCKKVLRQINSNLLSEDFWKVREQKRSRRRRRRNSVSTESQVTDDEKPKRSDPSQSLIFLPSLRDVVPEQHHMNLSTGRALVGRKVDCWLSADEYIKMTGSSKTLPLVRNRSNRNAFWPGHPLDKTRLWMSPCQSHHFPACDKARDKANIFHRVGVRPHNGKRTNHGYDNNCLTWPTDGLYVKFGDIEMRKTYQL